MILLLVALYASERPIEPIKPRTGLHKEKIALGKIIFDEPSLSKSGAIACSSCHSPLHAGANNEAVAFGRGCLNTPSIYNLDAQISTGWNGAIKTIKEHVKNPFKKLMHSSVDKAVTFVRDDKKLYDRFMKIYGTVDKEAVMDSLATYVSSLRTVGSRFDHYLAGDKKAITPQEKRGYLKFVDFGCTSCHNGMNVGGNTYMKVGIFADPYKRFDANCTMGRYDYTGIDEDKFVFRVPSLRNVTKTAPYFHDGSVTNLKDAINLMAEYQLGHPLKPKDVDDIAAFLKTLEAEPDEK